MIEPTRCASPKSGLWNRLTNEDRIGVGDVVLYRSVTPLSYEIANKCNMAEGKRGIQQDSILADIIIYDARADGYLSEDYHVWTRANRESCRLPLNPIFSKPLPLP